MMTGKKPRRYVIQRHERQGEPTHWDLMLESGDILETYRVNKPPEEWREGPIEAVKIFVHPLKYLTYEGPVNKGKGSVKIADSGTYEATEETKGTKRIRFEGRILKGEITLLQRKGNAEHRTKNTECRTNKER